MIPGVDLKTFWNDGELPGKRWLTQVSLWLTNLFSSDGSIIISPSPGGINFQLPTALANATIYHPFKIHRRTVGNDVQYAIADGDPDVAGTIAGPLVTPDGVEHDVALKAWATITATTDVYLLVSINEGYYSTSWATTAGTVSIKADPATLAYHIGTLKLTSGVWTIEQRQNAPIDLTGAIIPAWYAGYDATAIDQILVHLKGAAPSWFVTGTQTYERIPHWGTDNTLQTLDAQSASTHAFVLSTDNAFTQIVAKDCDGADA